MSAGTNFGRPPAELVCPNGTIDPRLTLGGASWWSIPRPGAYRATINVSVLPDGVPVNAFAWVIDPGAEDGDTMRGLAICAQPEGDGLIARLADAVGTPKPGAVFPAPEHSRNGRRIRAT